MRDIFLTVLITVGSVAFVFAIPDTKQLIADHIADHVVRNFILHVPTAQGFFEKVDNNAYHLLSHLKGKARSDLCHYLFTSDHVDMEYRREHVQKPASEIVGNEKFFIPHMAEIRGMQYTSGPVSPLDRFIRTIWFRDSDALSTLPLSEKESIEAIATIEQLHEVIGSFLTHSITHQASHRTPLVGKKYVIPLLTMVSLRSRYGCIEPARGSDALIDRCIMHKIIDLTEKTSIKRYTNDATYLFFANLLSKEDWETVFCPKSNLSKKCTLSHVFIRYLCDNVPCNNADNSFFATLRKEYSDAVALKILRSCTFKRDMRQLLVDGASRQKELLQQQQVLKKATKTMRCFLQ